MLAVAVVLLGTLSVSLVANAQQQSSATRSFSAATVAAGGQVVVTINAANYGQAGGVTETLPAGFSYVSSSLDDSKVNVTGQDVRFTLQGDTSFTYTVTASSTPGSYTFSGTLRDFERMDHGVGGAAVVVVSGTSSPPPTAATGDVAAADASGSAAPGGTVRFVVAGTLAQLEITGTADGVSASFVANGGQSIACGDNASCDTDDSDPNAAGRQNVPNQVRVALKIAADSGEGHILVRVEGIGLASGNTAAITKVINVTKATLVGSLAIKADTADDRTIAAANGRSNITVTVKNASTPARGLSGQSVAVTTTHGTVGCGSGAGTAPAGTSQACTTTTGADGKVDVVLTGGGVEGQAVVTARLGTRTASVTVTLFGSAKNLTAEPMQDSVEIGGSVFVVLTVTDGAGNPVSGQVIEPVSSKEVVGPKGVGSPVLVTTGKATGFGYSKDYINTKDATKNIPACGDDNSGANASPVTEVFTADGTNAAGKCVVHVTAPKKGVDGATKNATRGMHTLNFQISASIKASATIEVAGSPASISTDAPDTVEPGSVTEITVSVWDDEDILVGITTVKVRKVGGDGLIEDAGDGGSEMTSNGKSKFTFIAPSTAGSSEILISAGDVDQRVTVTIGEAMEEPDMPAMPEGDATLSVTGNLGVFSGGSLADLAAAAGDACPGGAVIWAQDSGGAWQVWSSSAPDIANIGFTSAFADGFSGVTPVWVSSCEADAMDSEG